jgi:hypothetical protein
MLGTSLEFARGTTEDCERLVVRLFQQPATILTRYRTFRRQFRTSDLVLETAEYDPSGFKGMTRTHYVARLRNGLGRDGAKMLAVLNVTKQSAHQVASLPVESDAFWLIINRKTAMPVMCVLFAAPYATGADAREPTILRN